MTTYQNKIIFIFALLSIFMTSCSEKREVYKVQKGDLVESVYSSVSIEPEDIYKVTSSVNGYLEQLQINTGDTVYFGQELFYIRDIISKNNTNNARLAFEQAEKNYRGDQNVLEDLRIELNNLSIKRRNDSIQYVRIKKLYEKDLVTKAELEQTELMYTSSKNAYTTLKNKIRRTEKDLKIALEQARNNLNSNQSRSDESVVRNRMNGIVYDIQKEEGEFVTVQEPVAIIGSSSVFIIKMLIDEVDIAKVRTGQRIIINLEAYKNEVFEGVVTRIAPRMENRTRSFEVEGRFETKPEKLYYGLTGEANIIVKKSLNTIVIPREYLFDDNHVETDAGKIKVKTGAKSLSHVEIIVGLKEGDEILKPNK